MGYCFCSTKDRESSQENSIAIELKYLLLNIFLVDSGEEQKNKTTAIIDFRDFQKAYCRSPLQHSENLHHATGRTDTKSNIHKHSQYWHTLAEFLQVSCVLLLITHLRGTTVTQKEALWCYRNMLRDVIT